MQQLSLFFLIVVSVSCSMQKVSVNLASDLFKKASKEFDTESNWDIFGQSLPGSLKMLEGLYFLEPTNVNLLRTLTKGYAGYAFGVGETLMWEEKYKNKAANTEENSSRNLTLYAYNKSYFYALEALKQNSVTLMDLQKNFRESPDKLFQLLNDKLGSDEESIEFIFYFAQSYASLVNLQKNDPILLAQLPIIKSLFDWSCNKKPDLNAGACGAFYGFYDTSRPKMYGGDPEKGKLAFEKAMKEYPENYLLHILYLQAVVIPEEDKVTFQKEESFLSESFSKMEKDFNTQSVTDNGYPKNKKTNFFNALAKKRWELMEKYKKMYF